ncbi:hypothetical protein [Paenibacillus ginsengihumi]|jgi:hypothetical protein|uniref:hypothetical protein n=1 Tax=Paenibacillus ginsengihumi TaxID=431596 RepID=UPI00037ACCFE|nr:hypothetical protein [Paenibacillus ginsengihumi]
MTKAPHSVQPQTVYQLEPEVSEAIHRCKENARQACQKHMYRHVRVQTVDHQYHDGVIVHVDDRYVYLQIAQAPNPAHYRVIPYGYPYPYPYPAFGYNPYYSTILPLVLFDLLTISLLY